MSKLTEYLDVERFDVSKEIQKEIASIARDLMTLSKKAGKAEGKMVLSRLKDIEDEIHFTAKDLEDYLYSG
jgi:hypothetical protein